MQAWIVKKNEVLLQQSKITPAKSLAVFKDYFRLIRGLEEEAVIKARYNELRVIKNINILIAYYKQYKMIGGVRDPRRKQAYLKILTEKLKKFVEKENLDKALLEEAKVFLSEISKCKTQGDQF